ncbi:hypothetical protein Pan44_25510 [Caulifigura coniformis]|uniref:DUF4432 domain-containing protein n=1 Tax=Caulifigura coniformis TaxID=2527983 RepID=A0A517SEI0_9PLAN|nr:aldose 1-epimerase family protein [Caulifigura coniformis]QDT54518.1 hypothetical protein Pan44_25510 [Caulifigura coniformis]
MAKKSAKKQKSISEEVASSMYALTEKFQSMPEDERDSFMEELDAALEQQVTEREVLSEHVLDKTGRTASVSRDFIAAGPGRGMDILYVDNGLMEIAVLPGRGMGIWKASHRNVEGELGWNSPVKHPVHPSLVNLEARNGLGWLEGFNELVCRCGLSSNGPPGNDPGAKSPIESALTLHGRIANLPAVDVEPIVSYGEGDEETDVPEAIGVVGTVYESVLFGPQLKMSSVIGSPVLSGDIEIQDVVENTSSKPAELQLLYHINIGRPFLEAGARLHVAAETIVPRDARAAEGADTWSTYLGPTPGYTEEGFFMKPKANAKGEAVAVLVNASGTLGVALRFDVDNLPWFVQWKCTQPESDGYVTGIEPSTNLANFKAYEREQGRVVTLQPGESYATNVTLSVLPTRKDVARVLDEVREIQGDQPPVVHRTPQPGWSPAGELK